MDDYNDGNWHITEAAKSVLRSIDSDELGIKSGEELKLMRLHCMGGQATNSKEADKLKDAMRCIDSELTRRASSKAYVISVVGLLLSIASMILSILKN